MSAHIAEVIEPPVTHTAYSTVASDLAKLSALRATLGESSPGWVLDSGATHHIVSDRTAFVTYSIFPKPQIIHAAKKGSSFLAYGQGSLRGTVSFQGKKHSLWLNDVLFAPSVAVPLSVAEGRFGSVRRLFQSTRP